MRVDRRHHARCSPLPSPLPPPARLHEGQRVKIWRRPARWRRAARFRHLKTAFATRTAILIRRCQSRQPCAIKVLPPAYQSPFTRSSRANTSRVAPAQCRRRRVVAFRPLSPRRATFSCQAGTPCRCVRHYVGAHMSMPRGKDGFVHMMSMGMRSQRNTSPSAYKQDNTSVGTIAVSTSQCRDAASTASSWP